MKALRQKVKELWCKLIQQNASPNAIAAGFSVGVFATFYPVPVIDTLVALVIARLVGANTAACLIGNNFILLIYPVIPFLLAAEIFVGRFFLQVPPLRLPDAHSITLNWFLHQTGPNLKALIIGGLLLGIPAALFSFWIVRKAAIHWRKHHQAVS